MKLVCPNCKKKYNITVDTPRIGKNIRGEYYYVCTELENNSPKKTIFHTPTCGGYMVVDMKALVAESLEKKNTEQGSEGKNN